MSNILERLVVLIAQQHQRDPATITEQSGLADLGLDSLAVAELLFSIEDAFGVDLGDVAPDAVPATVAELVALIERHRAAG